jgi:hypothetical protein
MRNLTKLLGKFDEKLNETVWEIDEKLNETFWENLMGNLTKVLYNFQITSVC